MFILLKKLPLAFFFKCQVYGNFWTFKWQFSGGSAPHQVLTLILCDLSRVRQVRLVGHQCDRHVLQLLHLLQPPSDVTQGVQCRS